MINLKFLNEALGNVSSDEFAVLYFIANTLSLKKEGRTRIYRELIADKLGWINESRPEYALKKVTRITNSLVEKGYLLKEEAFVSPQKSVTFYALSTQKNDKKLTPSTQKNVPLNKNEKKEIKVNKNEKEGIIVNKSFEIKCDISKEDIEEFCTEELEEQKPNKLNLPDEMDIGPFQKRVNELEDKGIKVWA